MNLTLVGRPVRSSGGGPDCGFTLIEVLLVTVILAVFAVIVATAVGGTTTDAADAACQAERRILVTAVETYFAQNETRQIPDAGGADGYERSLVDGNVIRQVSMSYDLDASGTVLVAGGSSCSV